MRKWTKWTFDICKQEALKYECKIDFLKNNKSCYSAASRYGWLDEITKHMKIRGDKYNRCIYSYEFADNHVYVGLTMNLDDRHAQHLRNYSKNNSVVLEHIKKSGLIPILKQLTDYIIYDKASIEEGIILEKYRQNGWFILNKYKPGSLGASNMFYTFEKCKEILNSVKLLSEVYLKYPGLLIQCKKNNWFKDKISNLGRKKKANKYWTKERCLEVALKYTTLKDFCRKDRTIYNVAMKKGFLEEITKHLIITKKGKGYWTKDKCFEESKKYKNKYLFSKGSRGAHKAAYSNGWLNEFF